ncbi:uncharacterized protein METZ01_LOCUS214488 [marine metagenome]|uniref:Uncharacterized protein n=1 Tax=marine metagenome TaxID=408172 RepID=A0A382FH24_9ZZZZ
MINCEAYTNYSYSDFRHMKQVLLVLELSKIS